MSDQLLDTERTEPRVWICRDREVRVDRTLIMGVLNVTPDSFSDGGQYFDPERAVDRALQMEAEGADIIDVGGESTRPGAEPVPVAEELRRVIPVLTRLAGKVRVLLSVDTYKAQVAAEALQAGVHIVNDISGLGFDPEMAPLVARWRAGVVIMHIKGSPRTMQDHPYYDDVVEEICQYFGGRLRLATEAGICPEQIVLDPGIGFGKRVEDNFEILRRLGEFRRFGRPVMIGPSRKSFIGKVLGLPPQERLEGTAAAVAVGIAHGADVVRVHDVREMRRVVQIADCIVGKPGAWRM
ncbi:MAG: dihydropteroate synthase [candidate division KSB1 bacterium]|nr:dihydropteroate synthase [candidate division KSB1 bacterium]